MKFKIFLILGVINLICIQLKAQSISWAFNQPIYSTDTSLSKYIFKGVYTTAQLDSAYDQFKFTSNEFYSSYPAITTSNSISSAAGNSFKLNFSLHSKSSSTYFYKIDTGHKKTAVFVIPGSGYNQSSNILSSTSNYHNQYNGTFYGIANTSLKYGDFYLYIKPNEDVRGLRNGYYKLNDLNLYPILTNRGTSYTSNLFVECFAIIKYLKSKYSKVIVVGLSQGGTSSLICGLETDPDDVVVSSGYSAIWDTAFYASGPSGLIQDSIFNVYSSSNIADSIKHKIAHYFFSWGNADVSSLIYEYPNHITQNKIGTLCNTNYHYGIYTHYFPFPTMDTFLSNAIKRPKLIINQVNNTCLSDSMNLNLKFIGTPPFSFDLFKDSSLLQSYIVNDTLFSIPLFQNGTYQFRNIIDNKNVALCKSREIKFIKSIPPSLTHSFLTRDCQTNKDTIKIRFYGSPPFQFNSALSGGFPAVFNTTDSVLKIALAKGNYPVISIKDSTLCAVLLNDTIKVTHDTLKASISNPVYVCDSNKAKIHFDLQGNAPWKVNYSVNGIQTQLITSQNSFDLFFSNGVYNFLNITDSTNCQKALSILANINYSPMSFVSNTPIFLCDSVKTNLTYSFQGNGPFNIQYSKNGVSVYETAIGNAWTPNFGNGNYFIASVQDATGCLKNISDNYSFQFDTIGCVASTPIYICDSGKTKLNFQLQGNAPWLITYTKNGVLNSFLTSNAILDLFLENGSYSFISVTDSKGCTKPINQAYNFNFNSISASISNPIYNCDSNKSLIQINAFGNSPFVMNYLKNNQAQSISFNGNSHLKYLDNGNYDILNLIDSTGCSYPINSNYYFNFDTLDFSLLAPVFDCDSNKTLFHFDMSGNAPFTLNYIKNGTPFQFTTSQSSFDLFVGNGLFNFLNFQDATNCIKNINQVFNVSYEPLYLAILQQEYDCDSNKYRINFDLHGNAPWMFQYTDGVNNYVSYAYTSNYKLNLGNGNWTINSVSDATGCISNVKLNFLLQYQSVNFVVQNQSYNCDSNKLQIDFMLYGNSPWTLNFVKNGLVPQYFTEQVNQSSSSLFFENGTYTLLSVTDNTNCTKNINFAFTNSYIPLTYQIAGQNYDCDSNALKVNSTFTGDAPWILVYQNINSGAFGQSISNLSNNSLFLSNGDFKFLTISDSKCTLNLNDTIHSNFQKLVSSLSSVKVDCDSGQNSIRFVTSSGFKPYNYQYFYNNQFQDIVSYSDTTNLFLPNGNYFIDNVTDSIGCQLNYNQSIQSNYSPIVFNSITNKYNCEKDSTQIILDMQNSDPTWLVYSSSINPNDTLAIGSDFLVPNGLYYWKSIFDSVGCSLSLNLADSIFNEPVSFNLDSIQPDCSDKLYNLSMSFQGKSPWELTYNLANINNSKTIQDTSFLWSVNPGSYYFVSIKDANQCEKIIGTESKLSDYLPEQLLIEYRSEKLVTIDSQASYLWFKDGELIDSTSDNQIYSQGNGSYYVIIKDFNGCMYQSQNIILNDVNSIILYPNPVSSKTILKVNDEFDEFWKYAVSDMSGQTLLSGVETNHAVELNFESLARGVYNIKVEYETANGYKNEVIRLIKN